MTPPFIQNIELVEEKGETYGKDMLATENPGEKRAKVWDATLGFAFTVSRPVWPGTVNFADTIFTEDGCSWSMAVSSWPFCSWAWGLILAQGPVSSASQQM